MYVAVNNLPNDIVHTLNAGIVAAGKTSANEWSLLSCLARYIFDGVFNNQSQIDAYPHHESTTSGEPRVRDVDGDGKSRMLTGRF